MPDTVKPKAPVDGEQAIREVFISPRVIDREAFNDYAGSLRRMIEAASTQSEALRAAATEADAARESLRELSTKHQAKFDLAARLLSTLDQRAGEAERLLGSVRDAAASLETMREGADKVLADHLATLETRLEGVFGQVQARVDEIERKANERAQAAARQVEEVLIRAGAEAVNVRERTQQAIEEASQRLEARTAELTRTIDDAARAGADRLLTHESNLSEMAANLRSLMDEARGMTDEGTKGALGGVLAEVKAAREDAAFALRQLNSIREHADEAKDGLGEALAERAAEIEQLQSRAESLRKTLETGVEASASAAETLRRRREELKAIVDEPLSAWQHKGEAIVKRIEAATTQAERAHEIAKSVTQDTAGVMQRLGTLVVELRPWLPMLVEGDDGARLPPPIRRMVDEVRAELARDLSMIATGMHQIAVKAHRVSESVQAG